ncbi:hypothetical protein [Mesorhizobium sp. M4B.F.Ca.ET.143.01.1.1]|uniref:hypothetical protein n=1 Tax=Mesorhizobium sp. M4B.F.Ca.ET.143.01.1.1 TaxID=2563947 RepID=UPI001093D067|nr:hypothetical protein [Mesorhizobium sp. M4B.F.Ca.ET.143.01.1.1]TGV26314.1 hypothetical protein EN786_12375 [Mesorhizobium sp. M4B.F.Ca.ET.143.01.1.1]
MIERVAKAICESSGQPWVSSSLSYREICEGFAIAAIEAMREPTEDMVEAFAEAASDARAAAREENRLKDRPHPNAIAECQWFPPAYRAMIDSVTRELRTLQEVTENPSGKWTLFQDRASAQIGDE